MSFWEKLKRKEVLQGLETRSSNSLRDEAEFSLQSFALTLLQQESALTLKQNVVKLIQNWLAHGDVPGSW